MTDDELLSIALAHEAADTGKRYTLAEVAAGAGIDLEELRKEEDEDWDD